MELRPEWGIGQILDNSGGNIRVFFVGAGEKNLKLSYVNLVKLEGEEAFHPVLDNLKTVKKDRGEKYHHHERDYKLEAHNLLHSILNEEEFKSLLNAHFPA